MTRQLDVAANRADAKWSRRELAGRVLWSLATPFFRFSPRPLWGWRRALLRSFGAKVGADVHIFPTVRIIIPWKLDLGEQCAVGDRVNLYALGTILIGPRATISQNAHICAGSHDYRRRSMPLLKAPIEIGADAWICADAFVGPGVTIGEGAILGARGVAVRDISPWTVAAGNPARPIGPRKPNDPESGQA